MLYFSKKSQEPETLVVMATKGKAKGKERKILYNKNWIIEVVVASSDY